ncbi:transmembrane protein 26-like [Lineus longissimus]|uniref:transmembrane protein 26-like n=1 Tax=Lineus longissimus TaxID=88925 RepID=UPI002B4DEECA
MVRAWCSRGDLPSAKLALLNETGAEAAAVTNMGCECAATTWAILMATGTRSLFVAQGLITVWRVVDVKSDPRYWCLLVGVAALLLETAYTLIRRKGAEFKWFAPSYLCFLLCTVPGIWFLELDRWDRFHGAHLKSNSSSNSSSKPLAEGLSSIYGLSIPIYLDADTWIQALQQVLMLLLVLARWTLPKGKISRERLSQILLVYIALASDIIELFDLYELQQVMHDWLIFRVILIVWTVSLMQFTVVLASARSRRSPMAVAGTKSTTYTTRSGRQINCIEVLSLITTMFIQDMPFLAIRLYIVIFYEVMSNTLLFFAAKNALIIAMQLYRLLIITCCTDDDKDGDGFVDEDEDNVEPEMPVPYDEEDYVSPTLRRAQKTVKNERSSDVELLKVSFKPKFSTDNGHGQHLPGAVPEVAD